MSKKTPAKRPKRPTDSDTSTRARVSPTQRAFLSAFEVTGTVSKAAELAEMARSNHYEWLNEPDYAAAFRESEEVAADALEAEARRRAIEGDKRPIFQGGKCVGHVQERSDYLLDRLLRGRRKSVFSNRSEITGADGEPLHGGRELTDTEVAARIAGLLHLAAIEQAHEMGWDESRIHKAAWSELVNMTRKEYPKWLKENRGGDEDGHEEN